MLTSRVCSDTSSIWCESVGIPRSHSWGSSWFVIWKKNCFNFSSKKQKLNSLGDVNCDVASQLHSTYISSDTTTSIMGWKKDRAVRPSWDKWDCGRPVLTKYGSKCCIAFFFKSIYIDIFQQGGVNGLQFESCLCFSGIDQIAPLIAWFGGWHHHSIMPQNISKWSDPKINSVGFLQRNINDDQLGRIFFVYHIFEIFEISQYFWQRNLTAKLPRFREFTFDARPALNLFRDPVLPSRLAPKIAYPCMVYSKSANLETGFFRTFRLKLCSKYTKHLVSIESYFHLTFSVFGHLRTQKQDNPQKNHHIQILIRLPSPSSHFPTSEQKSLVSSKDGNAASPSCVDSDHRGHWRWVTTTSNGVCVLVYMRWSTVYGVYILYHVYMI